MRDIKFSHGDFIVVKSWKGKHCYWTVINTKPVTKKNQAARDFHCHIKDIKNINAAKMLCIWASKIKSKKTDSWPSNYPNWMQEDLIRLLYGKEN